MKLVIRADAAREIGTGHVMRMLALAQAWVDRSLFGGTVNGIDRASSGVTFICAKIPDALAQRLRDESFEVRYINADPGSREDLEQTLAIASSVFADRKSGPAWIVSDGYAFDASYQRGIRSAGYKLLVVDDYHHLPEYECDILLNQNIGAEKYTYRINQDALQLMGTAYALLRREFRVTRERNSKDWKPRESGVPIIGKNVLITMGGADEHNVTQKVLEAIVDAGFKNLRIKVLIGAANPHRLNLENLLKKHHVSVSIISAVNDMPGLIDWADIAVAAAGSTCLELACFGIPMIQVIIADNQREIAREFERRQIAFSVGEGTNIDWAKLKNSLVKYFEEPTLAGSMVKRGQQLVDKDGAFRVCQSISNEN